MTAMKMMVNALAVIGMKQNATTCKSVYSNVALVPSLSQIILQVILLIPREHRCGFFLESAKIGHSDINLWLSYLKAIAESVPSDKDIKQELLDLSNKIIAHNKTVHARSKIMRGDDKLFNQSVFAKVASIALKYVDVTLFASAIEQPNPEFDVGSCALFGRALCVFGVDAIKEL